jgi:hypothetical protein
VPGDEEPGGSATYSYHVVGPIGLLIPALAVIVIVLLGVGLPALAMVVVKYFKLKER